MAFFFIRNSPTTPNSFNFRVISVREASIRFGEDEQGRRSEFFQGRECLGDGQAKAEQRYRPPGSLLRPGLHGMSTTVADISHNSNNRTASYQYVPECTRLYSRLISYHDAVEVCLIASLPRRARAARCVRPGGQSMRCYWVFTAQSCSACAVATLADEMKPGPECVLVLLWLLYDTLVRGIRVVGLAAAAVLSSDIL